MMSELIVCENDQELYDAWLGAIGEGGECRVVRHNPSVYPTFLTFLQGETTEWVARLSMGVHKRRHALGNPKHMMMTLCARDCGSSSRNKWAFQYRYRDHEDLPGILEKIEGWDQMDLLFRLDGELFHFPGWRPLELAEEAKRVLERHGVLTGNPHSPNMYSTMDWTLDDAHCNSTLVIPLHACYPRYRRINGEMASVEESRAALASERRFLDTWELLERTVFNKPYLIPK